MEYLGFNRQIGAVYEGGRDNGYRVMPPPSLTPIRFFSGGDIPALAPFHDGLATELFREDDFDPVTKLRRGRVFMLEGHQPQEWRVHDPLLPNLPTGPWQGGVAQVAKISTYQRAHLPQLIKLNARELPTIIMGWEPHLTFWKIVSIEANLVGTPVLSLRAKHSLGDTPEIIEDKVPIEILKPLTEAMDKVEASVNRLSPAEVIDRCRDALSIIFGHKSGDRSRDLSDAIKGYLHKEYPNKNMVGDLRSYCGSVVTRLHAQAKPNVQHEKGLRPPADSDADLALNCLKTVLIEFGWAR